MIIFLCGRVHIIFFFLVDMDNDFYHPQKSQIIFFFSLEYVGDKVHSKSERSYGFKHFGYDYVFISIFMNSMGILFY